MRIEGHVLEDSVIQGVFLPIAIPAPVQLSKFMKVALYTIESSAVKLGYHRVNV